MIEDWGHFAPPVHIEPIRSKYGSRTSPVHEEELAQAVARAESWIRRNTRAWPLGRRLAHSVAQTSDGPVLETRWVAE